MTKRKTGEKQKVGAKAMPTRINGILFPSVGAAAAHFRVTSNRISEAIEAGKTEGFEISKLKGLGKGSRSSLIVEHNGKRYQSSGYWARAHGFDRKLVSRWLTDARKRGKNSFDTPFGEVKVIGKLSEIGWHEDEV